MIKINVITKNNNWLSYIKKPNYYLEKKIKKLNLRVKKYKKKHFFFTLLLSDSKEIKTLNKKFRKKNKSTDVLSFPFQSKTELKKKLKKEKEIYLGDIIINFNKVKNDKNKKNFRIDFDRLWIHGFVHLFGHDHKKDEDFKKMKRIEKKYLDYIND
jgi:probable rRNA maturation factor|tara:strand:+ start:134 stop:601 length:468 start_codon:yes stop_codon:yes gene_type:complete